MIGLCVSVPGDCTIYLVYAGLVLVVANVAFMKKYYHLHEVYLRSVGK